MRRSSCDCADRLLVFVSSSVSRKDRSSYSFFFVALSMPLSLTRRGHMLSVLGGLL